MLSGKPDWTSTAGPRQTKATFTVVRSLKALSQYEIELNNGHRTMLQKPFADPVPYPAALEAYQTLGEKYKWNISRDNCKQIEQEAADLIRELKPQIPVVDVTPSQETLDEMKAASEKAAKERQEQQAKKDASVSAIMKKRPAKATALIVAELHQNESDSMTDYFHHSTIRVVAIGWRTGSRLSFPQLRKAAATFPETEHLGPGKGHFQAWLCWDHDSTDTEANETSFYRFNDMYFKGSRLRIFENKSPVFTTEAEIQQWIEDNPAKAGTEWRIEEESIEDRDYRYLKDGSRHSSGWCVRDYEINAYGNIPVCGSDIEDALPDTKQVSTPEQAGDMLLPGGVHITKVFHSKRDCDIFIVHTTVRVEKDIYFARLRVARDMGGWQAKSWKGSPSGYGFETKPEALAFVEKVFGHVTEIPQDATGATEPRSEPRSDIDGWVHLVSGDRTLCGAPIEPETKTISAGSHDPGDPAICPECRAAFNGTDEDPEEAPEEARTPEERGRETTAQFFQSVALRAQVKANTERRPMTQRMTHRRQGFYEARLKKAKIWDEVIDFGVLLAHLYRENKVPGTLAGIQSQTALYKLAEGFGLTALQRKQVDLLRRLVKDFQEHVFDVEKLAERQRQKDKEEREALENEVRYQKIPGFFPTPPAVVERMIELAELEEGMSVLEPSAGIGSILEELPEDIDIHWCEFNSKLCEIIEKKGYGKPLEHDCLLIGDDPVLLEEAGVPEGFDRILMNPPFENEQDLTHVMEMAKLLKPGGRLVAVLPARTINPYRSRHAAFKRALKGYETSTEELPENAFNGVDSFRNTGVRTRLLIVDRPEERISYQEDIRRMQDTTA